MRKPFAHPTLDNLLDLACRDGVDIRPTLLRVLTDLYVQKPAHSIEEEVQYVELALGLIDVVDETTRAAIANRLTGYPAAPAAILRQLGLATPEKVPAESLNEADLADVFFSASSEERRLILTHFDAATGGAPQQRASAPSDLITRLEQAALGRNESEFCRTLELALGVGRALAERIARDETGEPVVVAAKALGMKAAVFQRILLFLNPRIGQSIERVYDLAQLYDELSPASAGRMAAIWRQSERRATPRYQPFYADDARTSARSHAMHIGRRVETRRDPLPLRIRSNDR